MREVYICECCGFVSTKLSEFKMVGLNEMGNPVYACKQCPPFAKNIEPDHIRETTKKEEYEFNQQFSNRR